MPLQLHYKSLQQAQAYLRDGDTLLFRRRPCSLGSLIATAGRSDYSHAAKVVLWGLKPFCVEVREWYGGRAVTLASQVKKYPGLIDVYRPNAGNRWPDYYAYGAAGYMRNLAGCDYGYASVLKASLLHLPFVRLIVKPDLDDNSIDDRPPYCSQAAVMADRIGGGVDPVPHLADRLTEPGDLAQSPFYEYRFTLVPEEAAA